MELLVPYPITLFTGLIILVGYIFEPVFSEALSCQELTVKNGAVYRTEDNLMENRILVECHVGYQLEGNSELTCTDGTIDSALLPTCQEVSSCSLDCCHDGSGSCSMEHGKCWNTSDIVTGTTVHFSCNAPFVLSTSYSFVTCTQAGTFDREIPVCLPAGSACSVSVADNVANFRQTNVTGNIQHGQGVQVTCIHGYFMKEQAGQLLSTCLNGQWSRPIDNLCNFVGFSCDMLSNGTVIHTDQSLEFEKDEEIILTCIVCANTTDGLPLPEVSWVYPSKLREYVEVHDGDSFVHTSYINSMAQAYSTQYDEREGRYKAQGVLRIRPTMEVHTGEYTCAVKLVNETLSNQMKIKIRTRYAVAMWCLLILPVVLFIAIHCFYRKATINPFPPNKLTRDMMQEHDKKKKLDELRSLHKNPAYEKTPLPNRGGGGGGVPENHGPKTPVGRPRRGAVDLL